MEDQIVCYICYDSETNDNKYVSNPRPCQCKGSIQIHLRCLNQIIKTDRKCSICKCRYNIKYLPQKDGRELIIRQTNSGYIEEYTIDENGQKHGSYTLKNKDGQTLVYHSYIGGIMEGPFLEYFTNGQMKSVCKCRNNRLEGEFTEFYEDGSIREESYYVNGRKHGNCIKWKRSGYIRESITYHYENGELLSGDNENDDRY
jgi:antitoxin component YwqK of YwqJK toxin-antitoxin module